VVRDGSIPTSGVEPELEDVAVLGGVVFAFDAELAGFAGFGWGAEGDEIVERDGFGGDEAIPGVAPF
jgi:hypothetical protein